MCQQSGGYSHLVKYKSKNIFETNWRPACDGLPIQIQDSWAIILETFSAHVLLKLDTFVSSWVELHIAVTDAMIYLMLLNCFCTLGLLAIISFWLLLVKPHLHITSKSAFFVPFQNGISVSLWFCLHITFKISKVPLTKTVTLTVCVNRP